MVPNVDILNKRVEQADLDMVLSLHKSKKNVL